MTKHTPTPWLQDKANHELICRDINGIYEYIASTDVADFAETDMTDDQVEANARHIVHCVNTHDQLVGGYRGAPQSNGGSSEGA